MQNTDFASNLMRELGANLGIEGLELDEQGDCIFAIDELPVAIRMRNDKWQFIGFIAEVAEAEQLEELTLSADQWRSLLEINHALATDGDPATLTYDRNVECVLFVQPVFEHQLEAGKMEELLETFVHRMEKVREVVAKIRDGDASLESGAVADDALSVMSRLV